MIDAAISHIAGQLKENAAVIAKSVANVEDEHKPQMMEGLERLGKGLAYTAADVAKLPVDVGMAVLDLGTAGVYGVGKVAVDTGNKIGGGFRSMVAAFKEHIGEPVSQLWSKVWDNGIKTWPGKIADFGATLVVGALSSLFESAKARVDALPAEQVENAPMPALEDTLHEAPLPA